MTDDFVKSHVMHRSFTETIIDPKHADREESEVFRKAKDRLEEDGFKVCYICGTTENLQCHHRAAEWMFNNVIDFDKLKAFCEEWDIYGYGKLLSHRPVESVDDIRNLMYLCQKHHTGIDHADGGSGTGIHQMTFPEWIVQKLAIEGANPIPQSGETENETMKAVKEHQRGVLSGDESA